MTSGMDIVNLAKKSLGVKYVWGGTDLRNGMDCSGLVQSVFANFGIHVPRVTYDQINAGARVNMKDLRPGDLIFFATESSSNADHVGIYMGGGKFIHAPHTGDVVKISSLSGYYADHYMGGRRIAGVTGGSDGGDSSPDTVNALAATQATKKMDSQELAENYGLSLAFFDAVPELKGKLQEAVDGQWSTQKWTAAIRNTNWWKENSETQRKFKIMETTDPATFKANISATTEALRLQATKMGAVISDKALGDAARMVLANGWQEAQIQDYLGKYIDFTENHTMGGQAAAYQRAINETAYKNGLSLDDQAVKNYAAYIGRGLSSLDDVLAQVRQQAAGAYPGFSQQIMAGQNLDSIAMPYVQMMAQETGQPYTSIDQFTPQIKNALNRQGPDGQVAPMSLTEFQQSLRNGPDWGRTQQAKASTLQAGQSVLQMMGLVS